MIPDALQSQWRQISADRIYTPESDVYRRRILTYKDGPRAKRVNTFQNWLLNW